MRITDRSKALLAQISQGRDMTRRDKLELAAWLSVPAVVAQFSSIVMQYIDASMVGRLGAEASASIGLVTTTTWLFGGLCSACSTGFSVQVAHKIGANDLSAARSILRQAFTTAFLFSIMLAAALAPSLGLQGVWTAMCIELCFRGTIFLLRLFRGRWMK